MNAPHGRARPPGGPSATAEPFPARVSLRHETPVWVRNGAVFFVTGCCAERGRNQLCVDPAGEALLDAAKFYHERGDWFCRIFLLMPDHFHALVAPSRDKELKRMMGDWKRFTSIRHGVVWQKNFIDHRLRSDESWNEKMNYIRNNPIRAGLIQEGQPWKWMLEN